ncbi:NADPH-dependent ferric siderophore reductase, contains FAD-binding and SIP domains [Asanoa hainanensis]|uniref:NADPH-dependent ferric siderophore reductase, contains FAD-binding and SIP domains n=1 Tax=Asanoa hainanensis TaxID=560556 RepID=A0A239P5C6_9ACTN|nr:siderophore-interacting protein [Asanoa hainanensis]SNT62325.1 NADPH-dependent ferric siderophore reductase, contains FAD-binding and SIP domains [Asanoa hainanensis]
MTAPTRQGRPQHVLAVESTEQVGPHLVRVVLSGESLADFGGNGHTDAYVKLRFTDADERPVTRTYTVRWHDRATKRLAIDFVTHGDTGIAAVWAMRAVPGDELVLSGPGGAYAPDPATAWHVFAGDLSALPAISAALEALPADAKGAAYLEVAAEADILHLKCPAGVALNWLVNPDFDDVAFLARAVDGGPWPDASGVQVFVHGERESVKAIRAVLRTRAVPREAISISGYWARGRTEDVFQAEKREPIGRIE